MKYTLAILFTILFAACKNKEESIQAQYKDINEAVYASGNIYPNEEYKVFSNADGNVLDILVQEGDTVEINQILMKIDRDVQMAKEQGSQVIYDITKKNISANSPALMEYEAALQTLSIKLKNDSTNYVRFQNLYNQEATSKIELEKSQLNYLASKNEYQAKKKGFERLKNQLKVEYENAQTQYKLNAKDADNYVIKSVMKGRVYDLMKERGEMVRRTEAVALIGDLGSPLVRLNIDEIDLPKVSIGQDVFISIDMYANRIFKAKISKIYPKLNRVDQSFRVDAKFIDTDIPNLYGLSLEANIIVNTKKKALCLPKSYLISKDSLWLDLNGTKTLTKVETGISDFDFVEITKGITDQSKIYKP